MKRSSETCGHGVGPLVTWTPSASLMAISDDWGATWKTSTPLVGPGNIQP